MEAHQPGMPVTRDAGRLARWFAPDRRRLAVCSLGSAGPVLAVYLSTTGQRAAGLGAADLWFVMVYWILGTSVYSAITAAVFAPRDQRGFTVLLSGSERPPVRRLLRRAVLGEGTVSFSLQSFGLMVALMAVIFAVPALRRDPVTVGLATLCVTTAWVTLMITYTLHYARNDLRYGGLDFPGGDTATWGDYLYHAATVNVSLASSDVTVTSQAMRRVIRGHSLIAFCFNTIILALLITLLTVTIQD